MPLKDEVVIVLWAKVELRYTTASRGSHDDR